MNTSRQPSIQSIVPEQLQSTTRLVNAGKYADALKVIRTTKNSHPRNIYIIALEKQVERLSILSQSGRLTRQMKEEILGSLPGLVERATFEIEQRDLPPRSSSPPPTPQKSVVQQKPARDPVAENLKQQYFDQAERFMIRGAYDNAMAEIRRIQLIDPQNSLAKEYEEKIVALAEKRLKGPSAPLRSDVPIDVSKHLANQPTENDNEDRSFGKSIPTFIRKSSDIVLEETAKPYETKRPPIFFIGLILFIFIGAVVAFYYFQSDENVDSPEVVAQEPVKQEPFQFMGSKTPEEQNQDSPPSTTEVTTPKEDMPLEEQTPAVRELDNITGSSARSTETLPEPKEVLPPPGKRPVSESSLEIQTGSLAPTKSEISQKPVSNAPKETVPAKQINANSELPNSAKFVVGPRLLKLEEPVFPDSARQAGLSGQVIIHVQLDTEGRPINARVFKSSHAIFEAPSIVAALMSRFSPAEDTNGPVIAWMSVPFLFRPD